ATTIAYTGDGTEQYSDQQALTAILTDVLTGNPLSAKPVTFTIGTQAVSDGPGAPGNGTDANGIASAPLILNQGPASTYHVSTNFAGDATYLGSSDLDNFTVTLEDACANYNGDLFVNTSSPTSATAVVNLKLSLTDKADGYTGDIRNAIVKFIVT